MPERYMGCALHAILCQRYARDVLCMLCYARKVHEMCCVCYFVQDLCETKAMTGLPEQCEHSCRSCDSVFLPLETNLVS